MATPHSPCIIFDRSRLKKITAGVKSQVPCFRVLVVGGNSVGKTALTVRFLTKRFIGEYDSSAERIYQQYENIDGSPVLFQIVDTLNHKQKTQADLKDQINWADAFIVLYSVTHAGSFHDASRLKFLINHMKKSKSHEKLSSSEHSTTRSPVVHLVGNKQDIYGKRMVTYEQGKASGNSLEFHAFHEISVRESVSVSRQIFVDLFTDWTDSERQQRSAKISRSSSFGSASPGSILRSLQFRTPWTSCESKSRSPSPSRAKCSFHAAGSVSPHTFRIKVKQTVNTRSSPGTSHLGDDLWVGYSQQVKECGATSDHPESLSVPVPSNYYAN